VALSRIQGRRRLKSVTAWQVEDFRKVQVFCGFSGDFWKGKTGQRVALFAFGVAWIQG
jgi:hypothetical protein